MGVMTPTRRHMPHRTAWFSQPRASPNRMPRRTARHGRALFAKQHGSPNRVVLHGSRSGPALELRSHQLVAAREPCAWFALSSDRARAALAAGSHCARTNSGSRLACRASPRHARLDERGSERWLRQTAQLLDSAAGHGARSPSGSVAHRAATSVCERRTQARTSVESQMQARTSVESHTQAGTSVRASPEEADTNRLHLPKRAFAESVKEISLVRRPPGPPSLPIRGFTKWAGGLRNQLENPCTRGCF